MTPSVNLLPVEFLHERTRARRRQVWIAAAGLTGIPAIGACLMCLPTGWTVGQLTMRAEQAELEHKALMSSLQAATAQQAELVARLRLIVGLERCDPLPQRLATLARLVPEGVVLTMINVEPQAAEPLSQRSEPARLSAEQAQAPNAKAGAAEAAPSTKNIGSAPLARPGAANATAGSAVGSAPTVRSAPAKLLPAMQIQGLAANQEELMTLLERLERSGLWPRVELVIASRQASDHVAAAAREQMNVVAFEIRCYTPGETP